MLACSVVFTVTYGRYKINQDVPYVRQTDYKGVLSMWQIDAFEGGIGSRKRFLLAAAREYEKANEGLLVMVTDYTISGAEEKFEKGIYPDIISFGLGFNLTNATVLDFANSAYGGAVGETAYAIAWCTGGYVLIANPSLTDNFDDLSAGLTVSQGDYTQPLLALYLEGIEATNYSVYPPMNAYVNFTNGKVPYFLGTQRDVHRLECRGMNIIAKPLTEYNDLYQYVSVTADDTTKRRYAIDFVKYLISEKVQTKLNQIGMFSPYGSVDFDNAVLTDMQSVKAKHTLSVFSTKETLKDLRTLSARALTGEIESVNKIQNVLI